MYNSCALVAAARSSIHPGTSTVSKTRSNIPRPRSCPCSLLASTLSYAAASVSCRLRFSGHDVDSWTRTKHSATPPTPAQSAASRRFSVPPSRTVLSPVLSLNVQRASAANRCGTGVMILSAATKTRFAVAAPNDARTRKAQTTQLGCGPRRHLARVCASCHHCSRHRLISRSAPIEDSIFHSCLVAGRGRRSKDD